MAVKITIYFHVCGFHSLRISTEVKYYVVHNSKVYSFSYTCFITTKGQTSGFLNFTLINVNNFVKICSLYMWKLLELFMLKMFFKSVTIYIIIHFIEISNELFQNGIKFNKSFTFGLYYVNEAFNVIAIIMGFLGYLTMKICELSLCN